MPIANLKLLRQSFRYALRGIRYAWRHEQNFRIQSLIAAGVIGLSLIVQVKPWEATTILLVIATVLGLELANSIFEKLADILQPRIHDYVKIMKDLMAAAVLFASILAVAIGLIIFVPYFN